MLRSGEFTDSASVVSLNSQKGEIARAATLLGRLPPPDTVRWVVRRKADVLAAIAGGVLSRSEACERYKISGEELDLWQRSVDAAGVPGLRVTRVQVYREVFERYKPG